MCVLAVDVDIDIVCFMCDSKVVVALFDESRFRQWLCATACLWTAVTYGVPLARGNYAPTSSGPFSAARTSCGNVRTVLESSQVSLSGS